MNDWYELINGLETETPPLDDMTLARVEKRVRAALPRRRKRRALFAAIAAVLVLSACGYAVATGQFSDWFRQVAEDPAEPEASEELLASIGTVIGQSQTVDGVTMTLNGAIRDGNTLLLSLSVDGVPLSQWQADVKTERSWLRASDAFIKSDLLEQHPDLTEEDVNAYLQSIKDFSGKWNFLSLTFFYDRDTDACTLLAQREVTSQKNQVELTLHLEDLSYQVSTISEGKRTTQDISISGPFEVTFTTQQKDATVRYTGRTLLAQRDGYDIYVTGAEVSPFRAKIMYALSVPLSEGQYDFEAIHYATAVDRIRINGEEYNPTTSRGSTLEQDEDGNVRGSAYTGSFDRIVDPAQVEAIRVGGVWLELDTFTFTDTPHS